jgi:hypothetical protein
MRESSSTALSPGILPFVIPDPAPPASNVVCSTRTTRKGKSVGSVIHSAQMVPVLVALTDLATQTDLVREEIESSIKDGKEWTKDQREACKREDDRWNEEKKALEGQGTDTERNQTVKFQAASSEALVRLHFPR